MRGLHHVDLNVSDIHRSAVFYDRVFTQIGLTRLDDGEAGFDWIAPPGSELGHFSIGIVPARRGATHDRFAPGLHHLALKAESKDAVDALYQTLVKMRVEILDTPAEYPRYGSGYYAVFFLDPDGLKLEYVFHPETT